MKRWERASQKLHAVGYQSVGACGGDRWFELCSRARPKSAITTWLGLGLGLLREFGLELSQPEVRVRILGDLPVRYLLVRAAYFLSTDDGVECTGKARGVARP